MTRRSIDRRRLLQGGAAALSVGLAGCSGDSDDGSQSTPDSDNETNGNESTGDGGDGSRDPFEDQIDLPTTDAGKTDYAAWVPTIQGQFGVTYLDRKTLRETSGVAEISLSSVRNLDDAMLRLVLRGVLGTVTSANAQLQGTGIREIIVQDSDELDTTIDEMMVATIPIVLLGDIYPNEVADRLEAGENSTGFEQIDTIRGFKLYEAQSNTEANSLFAVGTNAILIGPSQSSIETVLATVAGDEQSAREQTDAVEWLLDNGGSGQLAFGSHNVDGLDAGADQFPILEDANGFFGAHSIDEESLTAAFAGTYAELSEERETQLDSSLGSMSESGETTFDGTRVTSSATYSLDIFDDL